MTDTSDADPSGLQVRRRRGISIVWLILLVAAVVAGWLTWKTVSEQGPTVTVTFKSASGLEPGKTKVKLRDIDIGQVEEVQLSEDLRQVTVTLELDQRVERHLLSGTRFWVVRPRLAAGAVSGLGTLVSGAYVEMDPGEGEAQRAFAGLEGPPVVLLDEPGRTFVLSAANLGGLGPGSPIYYRGLEVGRVLGRELAEDARAFRLPIFVRAPFDALVRDDSRFWNASGIDVSVGAEGFELSMESLPALLAGGVAFDTPSAGQAGEEAAADSLFPLYGSFSDAEESGFVETSRYLVFFDESVRGLSPGAPVEFRGVQIGKVVDLRLEYDTNSGKLRILVTIGFQESRLQIVGTDVVPAPGEGMAQLVAQGLRAQLGSGNLITGQKLIELDFHPDEPPAEIDYSGVYPAVPSVPSAFGAIAGSVSDVLDMIAALPLDKLVEDTRRAVNDIGALALSPQLAGAVASLETALASIERLTTTLDARAPDLVANLDTAASSIATAAQQGEQTLASVDSLIAEDSELRFSLLELLRELSATAQSIRQLTDYLEQHPEALLSGKRN